MQYLFTLKEKIKQKVNLLLMDFFVGVYLSNSKINKYNNKNEVGLF